jgi:diguanylate cyclase (GGDEF)-like protein
MKLTLRKNRTTPLILLAILGITITLAACMYYMSHLITGFYHTKFEYNDNLAEKIAIIINQEINNNDKLMDMAISMAVKDEKLDKKSLTALLPMFKDNKTIADMAVVDTDGKGYNLAGDELDRSDEACFKMALSGQMYNSDRIIYTAEHIPVITYALPIYNKAIIGVLITDINAELKDLIGYEDAGEDNLIYILNEKNELIAFSHNTEAENFNYNLINTEGYFYEDYINEPLSLNVSFVKDYINKSVRYIWGKKPLGINNWTVLVGSSNILSPEVSEILGLSNLMWVSIIIGIFILFVIMIISQLIANRKMIRALYLDPVTGGDNWYKFRLNVGKIINSKQFNKKKYVMINFDFNRFKIINDVYGYQKGDEVLKDIYLTIKMWAKLSEPFTRYAADQFYIMMTYSEEDDINKRIKDLDIRLHELRYTSISKIYYGVYRITETKDSIDRMGEFASVAKNSIKGSAEEYISNFDDKARNRLLEEEEIEKTMNDALKNNEFNVFLQPKYTVKNEEVYGAEALVRWVNKNGNMLSPGRFIPVFEKNGFITELDYYMLRKICEVIRGWIDKGYSPLPISVNISRLHFANPLLAEIIMETVDEFNVPHNLIELELTESAFLQDKGALITTVSKLREYGFLVSMDDFGAGYSSLNSLKDLHLDIVKLDGELFRMSDEVDRGLTVIRNTINMAKDLHMKVVAECIETKEQVEFLYKVGCDIIQGFYYAKPMPVDQFEQRYIRYDYK